MVGANASFEWGQHPKFDEYTTFIESGAKPECQDCTYLMNYTVDLAVKILKQAAIFNRRGTRIISIDAKAEGPGLKKAQIELGIINKDCQGPVVVANDMVVEAWWIQSFLRHRPEVMAAKLQAILPVTEACDLQRKHGSSTL